MCSESIALFKVREILIEFQNASKTITRLKIKNTGQGFMVLKWENKEI